MTNTADKIGGHNNKILKQPHTCLTEQQLQTCNCRQKSECPFNWNCLQSELAFQAVIETDGTILEYIGVIEDDFKTRHKSHNINLSTTKNTKWKPSF